MMKKCITLMLALAMLISFALIPAQVSAESTEITLWTYPIGKFGDAETVEGFIAAFNEKFPDIKVSVEYLDYTSGDDQVTAALEAGTAPTIIMEGPERLVSNWGAKGKMVDLSDLWTEEITKDIKAVSEAVVNACRWDITEVKEGEEVKDEDRVYAYYEYPLVMTAHTMAINKEAFEEADAMKYIDEETRTWTTENFAKALDALVEKGWDPTAIVYCGGQGGDQGTRALVSNLYGAHFTNPEHTEWTINSEEGKKALQTLADWAKEGKISYDAGMVASDELQMFANGTAAMSLCWNASNQAQYAAEVDFTPYAVAFPTDQEKPELCGGIWGFGIFNTEDQAKIDAAKEFIKFISDDEEQGPKSVTATGFFPVRESQGNPYEGSEDEERMADFVTFMPYLGDYYNVTAGWTEQRTAWWNMLQQVFGGEVSVEEALDTYIEACNKGMEDANKAK